MAVLVEASRTIWADPLETYMMEKNDGEIEKARQNLCTVFQRKIASMNTMHVLQLDAGRGWGSDGEIGGR